MKYLKDTRVIIAISFIVIILIVEIGKSVRITQLQKVEKSKIESIGEYEKKSKTDYLKIFEKDSSLRSE